MSESLIARLRELVASGEESKAGMARAAGLHANSLRALDEVDWNPTTDTLRKLENWLADRNAGPALSPSRRSSTKPATAACISLSMMKTARMKAI